MAIKVIAQLREVKLGKHVRDGGFCVTSSGIFD